MCRVRVTRTGRRLNVRLRTMKPLAIVALFLLGVTFVRFRQGSVAGSATPTPQERPVPTDPQSGSATTDQTSIRAGQPITFHIELDTTSNVPNSSITVRVTGSGVGADNTVPIESGKTTYDVPIVIPADAPGGTWHLQYVLVRSPSGMHNSTLKIGDAPSFQVIQESAFVQPTSAKVSISVPQTELLRREAEILRSNIETLKGLIAELPARERDPRAPVLLRENVLNAEKALAKTEADFIQLLLTPSLKPAASTFFDDLHLTYQRALGDLNSSLPDANPGLHLQEVRQRKGSAPLADAVFRAFELNQLAYNVVADTGSLTFTLKVNSFPPGATVTYWRRGQEAEPEHLQDPTNSEIQALPYAFWFVRFDEKGYVAEQREHDPFPDKSHVITVQLRPEKSKP